jgi:ferredoxin
VSAGDVVTDLTWRVEIDETTCIGTGMCVGSAPRYFRRGSHRSEPVHDRVAPDDDLLDTAFACPAEAIRVRDEVTGTVLVPEA